MRPLALLLLPVILVACGKPESIQLEPTIAGPYYTRAPIPLPRATVTDDRGRLMEPPPSITWEIVPPHVAHITDGQIIPATNGNAELRASIAALSTPARVGFSVRIVDDVDVKCPQEGCAVRLGERIRLVAYPLSQGAAIGDLAVTWHVQDPAVAAHEGDGTLLARAPGRTRVSATSGVATGEVEVSVIAPTDRIIVTCESTGESVEANAERPEVAASAACVLTELSEARLRLEAFAGAARAENVAARWQTTDERVVEVDGGLLRGLVRGSAVVSVGVGALRASFPVEVHDRAARASRCSGVRNALGRVSYRERVGAITHPRVATLRCTSAAGVACMRKRVESALVTSMDVYRGSNECCCTLSIR